jgi:ATP-dependent RNA helicase DeaD
VSWRSRSASSSFRFTKYTEKIFIEVLSGGDNIDRQTEALKRPTHIVVATPGRLLDLIERDALTLEFVRYVVLDEADEMLSMGFKKQLTEILKLAAMRRSTWLFSATFPEAIQVLIKGCMSPSAHSIQIDQANVVNRDIDHRFAICKREDKTAFIANFLKRQKDGRGLIFCRTKAGANALHRELVALGLPVDVLQGDLMQKERDKVMRAFKKQRVQFVVATDVAARGIDVEGSDVCDPSPASRPARILHASQRPDRPCRKEGHVARLDRTPRRNGRSPSSKRSCG